MVESEYVCPTCGARITRSFRTASVVRSCDNGCAFSHFLRADLFERVETMPDEARPEGWDEMDAEQRLFAAMREGVVDLPDLR